MGGKKNEERALFKNRISQTQKRKKAATRSSQKKTRSWRGGGRVYVLKYMVVTFPTCQAEMLALKVLLLAKRYDISVTKEVFQSSIGP